MFKKRISAFAIIALLLAAAGCASLIEEQGSTRPVPPEPPKEVKRATPAVGGYLGSFAADSFGDYTFEKKKTKEETTKKYKQFRGSLIRIENASVVPSRLKAGEKAEIRMTYAVLGAAPRKDFTITETRDIRYKGKPFGKPIVYVSRGDGTYSSSIPITLPPDAKKGDYKVVLTVQSHKIKSSMETAFQVK